MYIAIKAIVIEIKNTTKSAGNVLINISINDNRANDKAIIATMIDKFLLFIRCSLIV